MLRLTKTKSIVLAVLGLNLAGVMLPFAVSADTQTTDTTINLTVNPVLISYSSGSASTTVWYSARVSSSQAIGAYSTIVTYTITTN